MLLELLPHLSQTPNALEIWHCLTTFTSLFRNKNIIKTWAFVLKLSWSSREESHSNLQCSAYETVGIEPKQHVAVLHAKTQISPDNILVNTEYENVTLAHPLAVGAHVALQGDLFQCSIFSSHIKNKHRGQGTGVLFESEFLLLHVVLLYKYSGHCKYEGKSPFLSWSDLQSVWLCGWRRWRQREEECVSSSNHVSFFFDSYMCFV